MKKIAYLGNPKCLNITIPALIIAVGFAIFYPAILYPVWLHPYPIFNELGILLIF